MVIRSYRDLRVWHSGMSLVEGVYRASKSFPRPELFGLTSQIQRCAVSIPSNIAEGHMRESTREFLRFLSIALGSAAELQTQLELARRLGYLGDAEAEHLLAQSCEIVKMLHGLRASLRRRIRRADDAMTPSLIPNP
jgi:four helix bundle protein